MTTTWKDLREELNISPEDEIIIDLEKQIIRAMVKAREEQGLTQSQLADLCNVKQSVIARMESSAHSPRVNSVLKMLAPLGYTLQVVKMNKKEKA